MTAVIARFLNGVGIFYLAYLLIYATYLFLSVAMGAWRLYKQDRMRNIKNELRHPFYFPVSVLVPAHNEEVTILDSVSSLMNLDYRLYEIIVVDDGSTDDTGKLLIEHFQMKRVNRPIRKRLKCKPENAVYEAKDTRVKLTLIQKENGGKGDSLNMGINAAEYPYFLCLDADTMLQRDSLERIVQPVMEDDSVVAVGGLVRVAQGVEMKNGLVKKYRLPWKLLPAMQVMEYDRSFLASRIFLDEFNGNLIISGAFGLFKKDIVIAAGGYDSTTLGEDMELVVKLHAFCRTNLRKYSIRYEPNAVCWSQAPSTLKDLARQRRRWHLGLYQSMVKYRKMLFNSRFGLVGFVSYLYYLLYELISPVVEVFGILTVLLAWAAGLLNIAFMIRLFLFYALYGAILTVTAVFQRIYIQNLTITPLDAVKTCLVCFLENVFFRYVLSFIRITAFFGYKKRKNEWGVIQRQQMQEES